jgi:hypothetical protein
MVAVDTRDSVWIASGVRDILETAPTEMNWRAHLAGRAPRVKGKHKKCDHHFLSLTLRLIY